VARSRRGCLGGEVGTGGAPRSTRGQQGRKLENPLSSILTGQNARLESVRRDRKSQFTDALRGQVSTLAYAWEKLLELPHRQKDRFYLIASGVDIYRTQIARELRPISVRHLRPIHIVTDQPGANAKMQARAQKLREFTRSVPSGQKVTTAEIDRLMPSVASFRAVEDEDGTFILFEGVGRYHAIREALGEDTALDISVEVFRTKDPARTLRLVYDVQRANGLRPGLPGPLLDLIGPANSSTPGFLAQVWEHGLVRIFVKALRRKFPI
jgi:hypothetical protein